MNLQKNDFIEIEFTARIKNGEIFDSNIKEDLKKLNPDADPKPFVFCLGQGMFLKGVDDFLIGKSVGTYEIELQPEKAFGNRNPEFIKMVPMKVFKQQKLNPVPGVIFSFDNQIAKILTVSGGRIMVDFNNPIAGKTVIYNLNILRKINDLNEKIKFFNEFLFKQNFKFEIKNKKLTIEVEKPLAKFVEMFKEKFKEIFKLDLDVKEVVKVKTKE